MFFNDNSFGQKQAKIVKDECVFYCNVYNNLFILKFDNESFDKEKCLVIDKTSSVNSDIWHLRLGHLNRHGLKMLNLPYSDKICSVCLQGKGTRKPFNENKSETSSIGELIHTDIAGPVVTPTFEGYKYFQVLIDDYSTF